ncbi:MAG TPA: hypothetical protein VGH33_09060 [Isosphaeraceae bacterium]|jgi:hypothetical protein
MELPRFYLTERTTFDEAAAEYEHDGRPFGHVHDDWLRLLAKRRDGDELWHFAPPHRHAMRVWGVALARDGRVISTVIAAVD